MPILSRKNDPDCSKINLLYKNLEHVTHVTYSAEPAMLGWETIYALIEGQLIIAYFSGIPQYSLINIWKVHNEDLFSISDGIIAIFGVILAIFWLILVSLNYKHQEYRSNTIKNLELRIGEEYSKTDAIYFCPEDMYIKNFISNIFPIFTSTWFYRKMVPISVIILWSYILAGWISSLLLGIAVFIWIFYSINNGLMACIKRICERIAFIFYNFKNYK